MSDQIPAQDEAKEMERAILHTARIVLLEAKDEIRQLRRANELLRAKVEVMELFAPLIQHSFQRGQMMAPDVAHAIENTIKAIDAAYVKASTKTE